MTLNQVGEFLGVFVGILISGCVGAKIAIYFLVRKALRNGGNYYDRTDSN